MIKLKLRVVGHMKKQHNEKIVVGDAGLSIWNRFSFLKPLGKVVYVSRKKVAYALVPLLLIVVWGLIYYGYIPFSFGPIHPRYFAEVGGQKISYQDYSSYLHEAKARKIDKKTAQQQLIDSYKLEEIGKQLHYNLTPSEIKDADQINSGHKKTPDNAFYFDRISVYYGYDQKLRQKTEGWVEGAVIAVSFQQHILKADNLGIKNPGDPALIEQDRKRAEAYANDLYNRLINKKITLNQAVNESRNKLDVQPPLSTNPSLVFNQEMYKQGTMILLWDGVKAQLRKLDKGSISKPVIMKAYNQDPSNNQLVDSYYAIFAVTNKSGQTEDYSSYISKGLNNIKVKRYV
jgi:hypothetical protein